MKKKIHPPYYPDAKISCACGNIMTVGSTVEKIHVEICSHCHPFYTGKEKLMDVAGRVDRFKKMKELQKQMAPTRKGKAMKKLKSAERKLAKERAKVKEEITANTAASKHPAKKTIKKPGKS